MGSNAAVLVLGSSSFAGGAFINECLTQDFKVIGVSRGEEPSQFFKPYFDNANVSNFSFYKYDINKDINSLIHLLDIEKPRYVIDFAGQGMVAPSWEMPWQWYQTNLVAKSRFISHLSSANYSVRYVRISTPEVYGNNRSELFETTEYAPSTPYAISHTAIDLHLEAMTRSKGLDCIIGRFANFYGPSQQLYRIVPRTILSILNGTKLPLHGGGLSRRAFIHGSDVAHGIFQMMFKGKTGYKYHFTTSDYVSIRELVEIICAKLGADFLTSVKIVGDRLGKDLDYNMNCDWTKSSLGWSPRISLDAGLDQCIVKIKNNLNHLSEVPLEYVHKE